MVQLYANVTFKFNDPAAKVDPTFDAIDAILTEVNGASPVDAKQTATRYVGVATEKALSSSATLGTIVSMLLALLCILAATNNFLVTAWSMMVRQQGMTVPI